MRPLRTHILTVAERARLKQGLNILIDDIPLYPERLRAIGDNLGAIQEEIHAMSEQPEAHQEHDNVPIPPRSFGLNCKSQRARSEQIKPPATGIAAVKAAWFVPLKRTSGGPNRSCGQNLIEAKGT